MRGHFTLRSHLANLIKDYRIDTVLDVGANDGQFGAMMRVVGFSGDLHSFEPVADPFARLLARTAADPRWTAHRLALGNAPGDATINVSKASAFSSFLKANAFASLRWQDIAVTHQEVVAVSTVDRFIAEHLHDRDRRILLKMDTQGLDLKVFEGAAASLDRICALVSEMPLIEIYDGMTSFADGLAIYRSNGFAVSGFYPITRRTDLAVIEMDCVLVSPTRFPIITAPV